jgi:hypothetical protein
MIDKYLPVGSVVLLKGGKKRVLIIGRQQHERDGTGSWDYLGCVYPEGFLGEEYAYLFDHDQIERVFFIGFQDGEELTFQDRLLSAGEEPITEPMG